MTLRYMKIFVSVYEHNSITKAADVLHLAQPSVSLAIKEMEEYYGAVSLSGLGGTSVRPERGMNFTDMHCIL